MGPGKVQTMNQKNQTPAKWFSPAVTDFRSFENLPESAQNALVAAAVRIWRSLSDKDAIVSFDFECPAVPGMWRFLLAEAVVGLVVMSSEDVSWM
ncbi:MAG: hypothetical protein Q7U75_02190 [Desulfobacterales bacterium]|nr:hypothetical protein [Desulfobacterales bacterium]